jgi:hypothetical protein
MELRDDIKGLLKIWAVILTFFSLAGALFCGLDAAFYILVVWGTIAAINILIAWRWEVEPDAGNP